jgi:catechol 2,3-dioxygenase-like lactoylglutathione lyase family enzyme
MQKHLISSNTILYCRQWEKTVEFYRDGLNLPVLYSNDWFVEFQLTGAARLSIANESRSTLKSVEGEGFTLALEVDCIETLREFLNTKELNPTPVRNHPWNARVFYLLDPEGHRIEIWQALSDKA